MNTYKYAYFVMNNKSIIPQFLVFKNSTLALRDRCIQWMLELYKLWLKLQKKGLPRNLYRSFDRLYMINIHFLLDILECQLNIRSHVNIEEVDETIKKLN